MPLHPETETGLADQEENADLDEAATSRKRSVLFDQDFQEPLQELLDDQD